MALLGARGGKQPLATGSEDIDRFVSLEPTDREETVGGLTGTVYHLTYVDRNGRRRTEEAVLSKNPALAELTRSEEHTSELQSLMRISYAVFCLKKKKTQLKTTPN